MLPFHFWFFGLSSIILVCCFGVNDAIPFGSHPGGEVRPTAPHQMKTRSVTKQIVPDLPESLTRSSQFPTGSPVKFSDRRLSLNSKLISNLNMNTVHLERLRSRQKHPKKDHKKSIKYEIDDSNVQSYGSDLKSEIRKIASPANEKEREKLPDKCATEQHGEKRHFNQKMPVNASSFDIAGAFKVAGEPESKRTSSIYVDDEITLCWIETTTIKEDPAFDPPKRLVVREFAISFENSATIPDDYLECAKLDGEISPGDVETVCKTSLHEVIYENTKRSGVGNFTTVSYVGPIVVREQKKIRCATGGIVSKDVYEWPTESAIPQKRVEIKVGPSIRPVDVDSGEESLQCGTEDVTKGPEEDRSPSSVPNCNSEESCSASIGSSCKDVDCTTKNSLEEENATKDYSDFDELLSAIAAITRNPTTERSYGTETVEHLSDESVRPSEDSCPENDPNCELGHTTMKAVTNYGSVGACSDEESTGSSCDESTSDAGSDESIEGSSQCAGANCTSEGSGATTKPCSGEDCSGENLDKSTKVTSDGSEDNSPQCSGEDCTSEEESGITQPEAITAASNELCQEGSESCACNGSLCTTDGSGGSGILTVENKLTGETAAPSVHETTETLLKDSGCDGDSEECSRLLKTSSDEEEGKEKSTLPSDENDRSTKEPAMKDTEKTTPEDFDVTSITDEKEREFLDTFDSTEVLRSGELSEGVTVRSCDGSESGECATVALVPQILSNDMASNIENDSSSSEGLELSIITKNDLDLAETASGDNERFSPCKQGSGDESCQSTRANSESEADDNATTDFSTNVPILSENTKKIETPYDDDVTLMPTASVESEPMTIEAVTEVPELIKAVNLSDEELLSEKDSSEKENSTISSKVTGISSSTEINRETSTDLTLTVPSTGESSCDDGSSSGDCTRNISSEACDLSSGSCSSETNDSADLTDEAIATTTESTSRSTAPTLSLASTSTKGRHNLALRIKVLLEHINENKKKQKLVQIEKHLLLTEKPENDGNHSLLSKIRSLNNSINIETFKSIFNCTGVENLTENFSQLTEFKQNSDDGIVLQKTVDNRSAEESAESQDNSEEESNESDSRRKREISIPKGNGGEEEKNVTDDIKVKAIKESLPGVNEDLQKGLDHVLYRISQELETPVTSPLTKTAESSPSKILKILADPDDGRVHARRRRRAAKVGGVASVEELEHPLNGEKIDGWSNERFVTVSDGGHVRSLLEFEILRAPDE